MMLGKAIGEYLKLLAILSAQFLASEFLPTPGRFKLLLDLAQHLRLDFARRF